MAIESEDVSEDLRRIVLSGRLDVQGTAEIEMKFTALSATTSKKLLVDLCQVNFLASIAIRALITNAKASQMRGGRMALLVTPDTSVAETVDATGLDSLIPVFTDPVAAEKELLA
jgi:anti-anti-sigma factor